MVQQKPTISFFKDYKEKFEITQEAFMIEMGQTMDFVPRIDKNG